MLVRLETADPGKWIVKGGVALLLRLDPNRTSDDVDLTYVHATGEHAIVVEALKRAFAVDMGDFFHFEFVTPPAANDGVKREILEVRVRVRIGEAPWLEFGVDLGRPAINVPTDAIVPRSALTGLDDVDRLPPLRALALPTQIAEKTCAMFERHGERGNHSTRARDLVDVAMIATQVEGIGADELIAQMQTRGAAASGSADTPGGAPRIS